MSDKCNFCWTKEATSTFLTSGFSLPPLGQFPAYEDSGTWFACDNCAEIAENAPEALAAHAFILRSSFGIEEGAEELLRSGIERIIGAFLENKVGGSLPLGLDLPTELACDHPARDRWDQ